MLSIKMKRATVDIESKVTSVTTEISKKQQMVGMQILRKTGMNEYLCFVPSDCVYSPVSPQDDEDKLTWKDRFPGYLMNSVSILFMVI